MDRIDAKSSLTPQVAKGVSILEQAWKGAGLVDSLLKEGVITLPKREFSPIRVDRLWPHPNRSDLGILQLRGGALVLWNLKRMQLERTLGFVKEAQLYGNPLFYEHKGTLCWIVHERKRGEEESCSLCCEGKKPRELLTSKKGFGTDDVKMQIVHWQGLKLLVKPRYKEPLLVPLPEGKEQVVGCLTRRNRSGLSPVRGEEEWFKTIRKVASCGSETLVFGQHVSGGSTEIWKVEQATGELSERPINYKCNLMAWIGHSSRGTKHWALFTARPNFGEGRDLVLIELRSMKVYSPIRIFEPTERRTYARISDGADAWQFLPTPKGLVCLTREIQPFSEFSALHAAELLYDEEEDAFTLGRTGTTQVPQINSWLVIPGRLALVGVPETFRLPSRAEFGAASSGI